MRHSSTLTSCLRSPVRQAIQSPNPKKTVWFGVSSILELGTRSLLGIVIWDLEPAAARQKRLDKIWPHIYKRRFPAS
jgi:hypothetical protein